MILSERNSLEKIRRCLNIFYFNFQLINYFKINHGNGYNHVVILYISFNRALDKLYNNSILSHQISSKVILFF